LDNTDRNRTSPFAFTGNRFEFRAVGSSANCSNAMIALNSALANQLKEFKTDVDALIDKGTGKDEAIFHVLKKYILVSEKIRFEGDGYSEEWKKEAEKRGLTNIISVPVSISKYLTKQSKKVLIGNGIFAEKELESRVEVEYEKFTKKIQIEARVLGDLAINHIVPTAVTYQNVLIRNVQGLKDIFTISEFKELTSVRIEHIKEISLHVSAIKQQVKDMIDARKKANLIGILIK
jgi:glutamine synthetase